MVKLLKLLSIVVILKNKTHTTLPQPTLRMKDKMLQENQLQPFMVLYLMIVLLNVPLVCVSYMLFVCFFDYHQIFLLSILSLTFVHGLSFLFLYSTLFFVLTNTGTTKYCNMFLKGMKCTNSDCLYLHYLGDKEDSFTKEQMLQSSKQAFLDQTQLDNEIGKLFFFVVTIPYNIFIHVNLTYIPFS